MTQAVFITGAAAGIGKETARLFAANGWLVGAADRDSQALAELAEELSSARCKTYLVDVTDRSSIAVALTAFTGHSGGQLDVLHNNAGILRVGPFADISPEEHQRIVEVNVVGLMNVLHEAFPYLRDTRGARVINMSSASASYGIPDFASYSASKHAVRAMTEALNIEWEPHDIWVGDLMPPFVDTGMVRANEGKSALFGTLGINLGPRDVAAAVWDQAHHPCLHRPLSAQFRVLWPLTKSGPAALTRIVIRRLWRQR